MTDLPVNFKDAILAAGMNGKRRVKLTKVSEDVYEVEDVTEYSQEGSAYGSAQVNAANTAINEKVKSATIVDDLETAAAVTENGVPAGCKALAELYAQSGRWIGGCTIPSGSTSYTISNAAITADSLCDVYYAESSKQTVQDAGVSYSQSAGSLVLTFESALASAVTVSNVKVVTL